MTTVGARAERHGGRRVGSLQGLHLGGQRGELAKGSVVFVSCHLPAGSHFLSRPSGLSGLKELI